MPPGRRDRLTSLDSSFLHAERGSAHMHVGAVMLFEGPPRAYVDVVEQLGARLHLIPRYRQKLAVPPLEMGNPFWVDDPHFDIGYHVRHAGLPSPGSEEELQRLTGRIFSERLDRSRPLWEVWLVEGLADNRFALVSKAHHALIDGIAGVDLMGVLLDTSGVPRRIPPEEPGFTPDLEPSAADLMVEGLKGALVRTPLHLARRAADAARGPWSAAEKVAGAAEGLGELVWAGVNPAPEVPLNVQIGPHRRAVWVHARLEDFKRAGNHLGGTVNDVVIAVVTGGLRRWLHSRGVRTQGLELRGLVPVSTRSSERQGTLGNRIALLRAPLPVYAADPRECLALVSSAMATLKRSKQALGAEAIAGLSDFAPPALLAQASRLNFSTRLFNLIVTNVRGPGLPLYLLGRELEALIPVAFLPENHALAVAVVSYNGGMRFGLLGDYDALHDLDALAGFLRESLGELVAATDGAPSRGSRRRR